MASPLLKFEEAPKKRIRKSRSRGLRTKTGCLTCRKRHKKCDERLPVCGPCSISSRECAYASGATSPGTLLPSPSRPSPASTLHHFRYAARKPSDAGTARLPHDAPAPALPAGAPVKHSPLAATPTLYRSPGAASHSSQPGLSLADAHQTGCSPDTVASELLTANLASTRWLDLLAADAAQADSAFSLAPTPMPEAPAPAGDDDETKPTCLQGLVGLGIAPGPKPALGPASNTAVAAVSERHAWQLHYDIDLQSHEAVLFRTFAERAALWLDLFDPHKHFSNYAPRLALRNLGLMKAILALTARHNAIVQASIGGAAAGDPSEAVQYYYETLHYIQDALQYATYAHSEELLATTLVISTYEMIDQSDSNWKRHLKGVWGIQRSQNVHGASGGLRQAIWWAWLRQDLWAAFREKRRCFSFWRPSQDYSELSQDDLADRAVYLLSQTVNYCSPSPADDTPEKRAEAGDALMAMLERWKTFLGPKFRPMPTPTHTTSVFEPIWIHPPQYGVALQVYSFAKILIALHRPASPGLDNYLKTQCILSEAVTTICGIAMELKDEGCQIMCAQCLFGAGLCVQDEVKRDTIISLIDACEARTDWPMLTLRRGLEAEWAKVA